MMTNKPKVTETHRALAQCILTWVLKDGVGPEFIANQLAELTELSNEVVRIELRTQLATAEARVKELEDQVARFAGIGVAGDTAAVELRTRLRTLREAADAIRDRLKIYGLQHRQCIARYDIARSGDLPAHPLPEVMAACKEARKAVGAMTREERDELERAGRERIAAGARAVHNPENVPVDKLPDGYRFLFKDELANPRSDALLWLYVHWGSPLVGRDSYLDFYTYAVPITPETKGDAT